MLASSNDPSGQTRSLAISSNLDALLEHEERVRGTVQGPRLPHSQVLSSAVRPGNYHSVVQRSLGGGLSPPPRSRRRGPRSPRRLVGAAVDGDGRDRKPGSAKDVECSWMDGQQPGIEPEPRKRESTSSTNPYINPAPTLDELQVGHGKDTEDQPSQRQTPSQPSHSRSVSLLVHLFPAPAETHKNRTPSLHRRPRTHTTPRLSTAMACTADDANVVLDIRRVSNEVIDIRGRRRPSGSHASSRRSSSDSGLTLKPVDTDSTRLSFVEFFSPTIDEFPLPPDNMLLSRSSNPHGSSKPSSTLKPIFSIPTSFKSSQAKPSSRGSSPSDDDSEASLPPTTNFLDMGERTDLVRKSRKLTSVFGKTPGGDMLYPKETPSRSKHSIQLDMDRLGRTHHTSRPCSRAVKRDERFESHRHARFQSTAHMTALPGRDSESLSVRSEGLADAKFGSRVSFIDLSEEEDIEDEPLLSPIIFASNPAPIGSHYSPSQSQLSLYEAMTPEQHTEDERRRKRETLAKLHRFLGSRVPADLVLGPGYLEFSLPPIQQPAMPAEDCSDSRKEWLRRRRSSSAGDLPAWSDDVDRMKEELNGKEKAINVRRAQKMEKMFGVAPPQTLYHTRHSPSPSVPPEVYLKRSKSPPGPSFGGFIPPGEVPSPTFQQRNPNRSSYIKRSRKSDRPNTAESSARLLPEGADCYNYNEPPVSTRPGLEFSLLYHHYQHSLKSLGEILDRDDKESLAELHQYLNDFDETNPTSPGFSPLRETPLTKDRRLSNASSIRSERRRSLPARTSMVSIASEYSITTPKPEVSDFQVRRRRAAKLTQFFGVNYRELINDVLESLETGLEHERKRGTLRAEELEDLLERLRKIKTNRKGFF